MNYPGGIKNKKTVNTKVNISFKNRGMDLEDDLNSTNNYYIDKGIAYIYKKPTPIKLVKVDKKLGKISEAYFDSPSTTDYNGIYKGYYIDYEAKETENAKGFPLINIHKHQIQHIRNIDKEKGICFLIVRFNKVNKTYLLEAKDFIYFIDNIKKSIIPISYFEDKGYNIKDKFIPRIDYLEIVNKILEVRYGKTKESC